jgi:hypothetical protein
MTDGGHRGTAEPIAGLAFDGDSIDETVVTTEQVTTTRSPPTHVVASPAVLTPTECASRAPPPVPGSVTPELWSLDAEADSA